MVTQQHDTYLGQPAWPLPSSLIYWDPTKHAAPLALPSFKVLGHLVKIIFLGKTLQSIFGAGWVSHLGRETERHGRQGPGFMLLILCDGFQKTPWVSVSCSQI